MRERADLARDWCAEGERLRTAQARVPIAAWEALRAEFADVRGFEGRAAEYLLPLTGLTPELFDKGTRERAIDIVLHGPAGCEVVEVTSTIDERYQRLSRHAEKLAAEVSKYYRGGRCWNLSLRHGWLDRIEGNKRERDQLHRLIADELRTLDERDSAGDELKAADWINVATVPGGEPGVHAVGRSAGVLNAAEPYLTRLTGYLAASPLIASKMRKLRVHAHTLGATRSHLYLMTASTGESGNLMVWSPAALTQGTFAAPAGLTDLWLEGGTGDIYHWTTETGWLFHRAP